MEQEPEGQQSMACDQPILAADAVEVYLASLRDQRVPVNTITSYAHDLRLFLQGSPVDLRAVTEETVRVFVARFDHLSAATRRRRHYTLCAFFQWLVSHRVVPTNPMEHLDAMVTIEQEPHPLSPDIITRILQAIPPDHLRDRALFTMLYDTGIRVGEALGLLVSEVDLTPGAESLRIVGRGQRARTIPLTAATESVQLLRRHMQQSQYHSGSLFRGDLRYGAAPCRWNTASCIMPGSLTAELRG